MPRVPLTACRPEPIASYLTGLAVLRLVAEQLDRNATGHWHGDVFVVTSTLDADGLVEFLSLRYQPTPLVAPWNNGSGFGAGDKEKSRTAYDAVMAIASTTMERLLPYRQTIAAAQRIVESQLWLSAVEKRTRVALCRNELPDDVLPWLDAAVVLTDDIAFPPLLGSGGNIGRFDLSSNFMQRLAEVFGLTARNKKQTPVDQLLRAALFESTDVVLDAQGTSQYDGGATQQDLGNPWSFVLLLEGALVFASAAARRMNGGPAALATPFTVAQTAAGHGTAADEKGRGELWTPLWDKPATYAEVSRMISEGRVSVAGRQARNGLDAARAISALGVDRGITAFARHAFLERNGQANVIVPLGRIDVRQRAGVSLLGILDQWTNRVRRETNPPGSIPPLLRRMDATQFALASDEGAGPNRAAARLQELLFIAAQLESAVLRSRTLSGIGPIRRVTAREWLKELDDGSHEFAVAAALASLRERSTGDGVLRGLFEDLSSGLAKSPPVNGLGVRPLIAVLADAHATLAIKHPPRPAKAALSEGSAADRSDGPLRWLGGLTARPASLVAASAFAAGHLDDDRIARLLKALLLLDWRTTTDRPAADNANATSLPLFALLAPCFHHRDVDLSRRIKSTTPTSQIAADDSSDAAGRLPLADPSWPRLLRAGRGWDVVAAAVRAYRIAGQEPLIATGAALDGSHTDTARLAAALLIPLSDGGIVECIHRVTPDPDWWARQGQSPDDSEAAADRSTELPTHSVEESEITAHA
jgi:CRISPR-associated protein Csx17